MKSQKELDKIISRANRTFCGRNVIPPCTLGVTLPGLAVDINQIINTQTIPNDVSDVVYNDLKEIDTKQPELPEAVTQQVEISIKYEGYIKRQLQQVEQFKKLEKKKLSLDFDYSQVPNLRKEAIQKLNEYQPASIGQASRISGVSPADVSVLLVYLNR